MGDKAKSPTGARKPGEEGATNSASRKQVEEGSPDFGTRKAGEEGASSSSKRRCPKMKETELKLACEWGECKEVSPCMKEAFLHVSLHIQLYLLQVLGPEPPPLLTGGLCLTCWWRDCGAQILGSIIDFNRHVYFHVFHVRLKRLGAHQAQSLNLGVCLLGQQSCNWIPELPDNLQCLWRQCKIIFDNPYHFYSHVGHHSSECDDECSLFKCEWAGCQSTVRGKNKMKEHLRRHTQEKQVACPTCGGLFSSHSKLTDHILRQGDTEVLRYECSHCNRRFSTERMLREHMRRHVNTYKCPMCEMTCPAPFALRTHIRYKHSEEKPFKCGHCKFSAKSSTDLRKHLDIHNVEDQFSCHIANCPFSARSYSSLALHFKKHHESVAVNIPRYICHVCKRVFGRGFTLTHHLKSKHQFQWPPGHSRFRYKLHEDGYLRLQTVRYECAELEELPAQTSDGSLPKTSGTARLRRKRVIATNMAPQQPSGDDDIEAVDTPSNGEAAPAPADLSSANGGEKSTSESTLAGEEFHTMLTLPPVRKRCRKKKSKAQSPGREQKRGAVGSPEENPSPSPEDSACAGQSSTPAATQQGKTTAESIVSRDTRQKRKRKQTSDVPAFSEASPADSGPLPEGRPGPASIAKSRRGRKKKAEKPSAQAAVHNNVDLTASASSEPDSKKPRSRRQRSQVSARSGSALRTILPAPAPAPAPTSVLLSMPIISPSTPAPSAVAASPLPASADDAAQEQRPESIPADRPRQQPAFTRSDSMELDECPPQMVEIRWVNGEAGQVENDSSQEVGTYLCLQQSVTDPTVEDSSQPAGGQSVGDSFELNAPASSQPAGPEMKVISLYSRYQPKVEDSLQCTYSDTEVSISHQNRLHPVSRGESAGSQGQASALTTIGLRVAEYGDSAEANLHMLGDVALTSLRVTKGE